MCRVASSCLPPLPPSTTWRSCTFRGKSTTVSRGTNINFLHFAKIFRRNGHFPVNRLPHEKTVPARRTRFLVTRISSNNVIVSYNNNIDYRFFSLLCVSFMIFVTEKKLRPVYFKPLTSRGFAGLLNPSFSGRQPRSEKYITRRGISQRTFRVIFASLVSRSAENR